MPIKNDLKKLAFNTLAAGVRAFRPAPPPLDRIRSFVILLYPFPLGSAVHALPLIPALRAAVPDAEIVVCASGFALELLRNSPEIDRLVETPDPTHELLPAARAIRAALPGGTDYATLTPTHSERTTIALAGLLAGAGNFVGYTLAPELYSRSLTYDPVISRLANNLRLVEALGHPPAGHFEPKVFFSAEDLAYAKSLIARFDEPTRPIAALVTQFSMRQHKGWRPERFEAVANTLIEQYRMNLLLVGAKHEREGVEALAAKIGPRALNVAGETNLTQLAALFSLSKIGVTLDTGTLHIGRAAGLPMVIIAPAWSPVHEWLPIDDPRYVVLKNLDMPVSPPDYIIDEVSVEDVVSALARLPGMSPSQD